MRQKGYPMLRWVPNDAVLGVIRDALRLLRAHGRQSIVVSVTLYVENTRSASAVPDVTGNTTNFISALEDEITKVRVDGSPNALHTFAAFCSSDIFVTGKSGFSHLAAMLCPSIPLVLAVPFWIKYSNETPHILPLTLNNTATYYNRHARLSFELESAYSIDEAAFESGIACSVHDVLALEPP